MIDKEFEWDDDKAASNAEKHGVSFAAARSVFRDPFAIELLDDRLGPKSRTKRTKILL